MLTTITAAAPTMGPAYDKNDPATRGPWMDFRRGGITATDIRDWRQGSKRRAIISGKVTGQDDDGLSDLPAYRHGSLREPRIGQWVQEEFGITPVNAVFAHAENPRYIASPDGVTLDPFNGSLVVGTPDTALLEIKTGVHDLMPGPIDAHRMLIHVTPGCKFDQYDYYAQIQWQMFVMNAAMTLFVWEQHNGQVDPETGTYTPSGPPQYVWIARDQAVIDTLVEMADEALETIDNARVAAAGFLPDAEAALPTEHSILMADYLAALEDEKDAAATKVAAFRALQEAYVGEGKNDLAIDAGFATLTVSTTSKPVKTFDEDAARAEAPEVFEAMAHLVAKHTSTTQKSTQSLTVRRRK